MEKTGLQGKVILIRWAVWGQAIGILTMAFFLAAEDAPNILKRASLLEFILPIVAIVLVQMRRPSTFLAKTLSAGMIATLIIIVSLFNAAGALVNTLDSFAIPESLVTPGWEYTQNTSLVVLIIFSLALIINIVLTVRALQGDERSITNVQKPVR
jgi:hypothetical protein